MHFPLSPFVILKGSLHPNFLLRKRMRFPLILLTLTFPLTLVAQSPLQQKAWSGDPRAMLDLAEAFRFGGTVEKNLDSAALYMKKAAATGHPDALFLVGVTHMSKIYDPKEFAKGVAMVDTAAKKGNVDALWKMSELHRTKGTGTAADKYYSLAKSYDYAERAATGGHIEALVYAAESRLTGTGTTRHDSLGVAYMHRAATQRQYVPAMIRMGDLYLEGRPNQKPEPFAALSWYQRAINAPHASITQKSSADIGIYRVDRILRQVHNATMQAGGFVPAGAFEYQVRRE